MKRKCPDCRVKLDKNVARIVHLSGVVTAVIHLDCPGCGFHEEDYELTLLPAAPRPDAWQSGYQMKKARKRLSEVKS